MATAEQADQINRKVSTNNNIVATGTGVVATAVAGRLGMSVERAGALGTLIAFVTAEQLGASTHVFYPGDVMVLRIRMTRDFSVELGVVGTVQVQFYRVSDVPPEFAGVAPATGGWGSTADPEEFLDFVYAPIRARLEPWPDYDHW